MNAVLNTLPSAPISRLPKVGTTIFTVMSALAAEKGAINLGQGFPDFECDPALLDAVNTAMRSGMNQYPPMAGLPVLRERVAEKMQRMYGRSYDPVHEITITAGATQAILTAILALVHPGDEVIVLEPVYDSYVPNIELAGGKAVPVQLNPADYSVPWDKVAAAITPRTRLIMINSPHNPTGTTFKHADMQQLEALVTKHGLYVISDEVYEHMVFDGVPHLSAARYPALAQRTVVVSSFGKTFHVTGWKVGYVAAPTPLMAEFRKVHQFNVFTVNTPMQAGLAAYMQNPAPYLELPAFYQKKRDLFRAGLANTKFKLYPCAGTYFQLVNYSAVRDDLTEEQFAKWLTTEVGVAAIPVSCFYGEPTENKTVRFCFAKKDGTLEAAISKLLVI
ncbi:MAG: pyridoxal phosphate-dependent aminotransferase [Burkholderiaceae bacterium]